MRFSNPTNRCGRPAAKFQKQFGGVAVPRKNDPICEGFDLSLEFNVGSDLAVRIVMPSEFGEPAAQLLLDGDNGHALGCAAHFKPTHEALAGG